MDLKNIGFDAWFQGRQLEILGPGCRPARVTAVNRDCYLVRTESVETRAELSGAFMYAAESPVDYPVTGDWASVELYNQDTLAIIQRLFPRKTELRRKAAGKTVEFQLLAANIDTAFIIQAADFDFNLRRLERYLVMVKNGGITPVILLSKSDLVGAGEMAQKLSGIEGLKTGAGVYTFSSTTGAGLEEISKMVQPGKTFCLLGSSGVGKTTLLNRLLGREEFDTNPVRADDGRGRHTTTRRQLVNLPNGALIIDTPGTRELGNIAVEDALGEVFADVSDLASRCRFKDCSHTVEDGCAVLAALRSGGLPEERYQSYLKLHRESVFNELSLAERHQKDRKFGKMVKSAIKNDKRKV